MRAELELALRVPRWAWRFYLRHLPLVVGLSLIPSVQRLAVVQGRIPAGLTTASEVVVTLVRLGLFAAIWCLAVRGRRPRLANGAAFAREHWRSLVIQGGLLAVAFGVFDLLAEHVVAGMLPESARQSYLAWLLFLKNPTIIALTFVWWAGLLRQALCAEPVEAR